MNPFLAPLCMRYRAFPVMALLSRISLLQKFAILAFIGALVSVLPTFLHVRDALRTNAHGGLEFGPGARPIRWPPGRSRR